MGEQEEREREKKERERERERERKWRQKQRKRERGRGEQKISKKIFLHTFTSDREEYAESLGRQYLTYGEFFTVDVESGHVSALGHLLLEERGQGVAVAIGPIVYIMGDPELNRSHPKRDKNIHLIHKGASYLDLSRPSRGWKQARPMKGGIHDFGCAALGCAALGGKIYLFCGWQDSFWYSEVYDPELNRWDTLTARPVPGPAPAPAPARRDINLDDLTMSSPAIADPSNDRILVHLRNVGSIYAYYPGRAEWACVVGVGGYWGPWDQRTVLVDGILYTDVSSCELEQLEISMVAYDLAAKACLDVSVSHPFERRLSVNWHTNMIHLGGGQLCLCTFGFDDPFMGPKNNTFIILARFRVQLQLQCDRRQVLVTPISIDRHDLPSTCCVVSFLPL